MPERITEEVGVGPVSPPAFKTGLSPDFGEKTNKVLGFFLKAARRESENFGHEKIYRCRPFVTLIVRSNRASFELVPGPDPLSHLTMRQMLFGEHAERCPRKFVISANSTETANPFV